MRIKDSEEFVECITCFIIAFALVIGITCMAIDFNVYVPDGNLVASIVSILFLIIGCYLICDTYVIKKKENRDAD